MLPQRFARLDASRLRPRAVALPAHLRMNKGSLASPSLDESFAPLVGRVWRQADDVLLSGWDLVPPPRRGRHQKPATRGGIGIAWHWDGEEKRSGTVAGRGIHLRSHVCLIYAGKAQGRHRFVHPPRLTTRLTASGSLMISEPWSHPLQISRCAPGWSPRRGSAPADPHSHCAHFLR